MQFIAPDNFEWTIKANKGITNVFPMSGTGSAVIQFFIPGNPSCDSRETSLVVLDGNAEVKATFAVSEAAGTGSFSVSTNEFVFSATGASNSVFVTAGKGLRVARRNRCELAHEFFQNDWDWERESFVLRRAESERRPQRNPQNFGQQFLRATSDSRDANRRTSELFIKFELSDFHSQWRKCFRRFVGECRLECQQRRELDQSHFSFSGKRHRDDPIFR